ncbi:hypothetical protein ACFPT7_02970 [Acidicapsa dinghuensis]|uniref:Uncharacterized protein n=1 Tax=Acidicapsa dinghuensis TaxID=2218256 RepID=A0ABW1EB86_9BACT|nr:hypothetical protein [Acidicapsa dinghuensis]
MFEQAVFPVQNEQGYKEMTSRIEAALAPNRADLFLGSVAGKKLRVRQFEEVLTKGLLGKDSAELYKSLPTSDQALVREHYLARIEKVPVELRQRFLKVYAYY